MTTRNFFINAVGMVSFAGHESIPTAIRYRKNDKSVIGIEAIRDSTSVDGVNEDFKIDLGKVKPGQAASTRARFVCGDGEPRSAYNIAADFFARLHSDSSEHLASRGMELDRHVLISEPLSFHADSNADWLENYRGNLRRILKSGFEDIEFLPEPFAVYQYYRYGMKHLVVAQDRKHCALVIDFGGGTFDASVVETTKTGDISQKGRHARPLGAHSRPIGGFEINRELAKALLTSAYADLLGKDALKRGFENYYRVRSGELQVGDLSVRNQTFLGWFGSFLREVEAAKIELSRKITDWRLDAALSSVVTLTIPSDPFESVGPTVPLRATAEMLRRIFVEDIWKRLRGCVRAALDHARKELDGRPIDILLLSGGSANLRWLEVLLRENFKEDLSEAHVVSLRESYQEVVAKGLAIECARRGYEENSEFADVTYNPLFLVLDPDDKGTQVKHFKLTNGPEGLVEPTEPAELLPSAEALETEEEQDLVWKVKLDRPPKHHLSYYFSRGSIDPDNLEDRYNIVETRLATPHGVHFDPFVRVQLRIRNDGTCTPRFIYRSDASGRPADAVDGDPFCIDLVSANQLARRHAFVGIDFGTASSAVSYVDWHQIEIFESRGKDEVWLSLNELIDLPTPIAVPLKAMLGAVGREDVGRFAMDALEGMLCLAAFACWADASSSGGKLPKCFNPNWKRSAGHLKKLLLDIVDSKATGDIVGAFRKRITPDVRSSLDVVIQGLDDEKHHKRPPGSCDPRGLLENLGNACKEALTGWEFGYFEDVRKAGFQQRFSGMFRIAEGAPPFHRQLRYEGSTSFSEEEAVLVRQESGDVLSLSPLYIWRRARPEDSWLECMVFDGVGRAGDIAFKTVGTPSSISLVEPQYDALRTMIQGMLAEQIGATRGSGCKFSDTEGGVF